MLLAVIWDLVYEQPFYVAGPAAALLMLLLSGFICLTIFEVGRSYVQSLLAGWRELRAIVGRSNWRNTTGASRAPVADSIRL